MKLKGIVLAVILSLASIMMPFNVYADSISASNIIGVNVELLGSSLLEHRTETVQTNTYNYYLNQYTYKAFIELDNSYVGVIGARVQGNYYDKAPSQGSSLRTESLNHYRKIYVNGNTAEMTFVITSWISSYDDPLIYRADGTSPYVTIEDSNVTKFEDIDSIEQIINLLSDIYQNSNDIEGLSTNQLLELQNIVANTSLANTYLETISKIRQWHVPFESLSIVLPFVSQFSSNIVEYGNLNLFQIPIFNISANVDMYRFYGSRNRNYVFIFYLNDTLTLENYSNVFSFTSGVTVSDIQYLSSRIYVSGKAYNLHKMILSVSTSGVKYINTVKDIVICPIYFETETYHNVSTEFALQFGLTNSLLDNIQIIAQGTTQSNSAASDLESGNDQMADDMDDLATIENGYNQQFNNQLQQIDFSSPLQSNAGILPAANFVITIFNALINNNPFSVLIIIVCILLIGKKVIGK